MDFDNLKMQVIGHVFREWEESYGSWLCMPGRTEAEINESLRTHAAESELLSTCNLSPEDVLMPPIFRKPNANSGC